MVRKQKTLRFWLLSGTALAALFAGIGFAATHFVLQAQIESFAGRFGLLSSLRKQALEEYFDTARAEITFWSLNEELQSKQAGLVEQWERYRQAEDDPAAKVDYEFAVSALQAELHVLAKLLVAVRGYYDLFLIHPAGDVLYSVEKEADFGTNLKTGPWRDTGLADVFDRALASARDGGVVLSDFESYGPSAGAPAMFMAKAMVDAEGDVLAYERRHGAERLIVALNLRNITLVVQGWGGVFGLTIPPDMPDRFDSPTGRRACAGPTKCRQRLVPPINQSTMPEN